MTAGCSRMFRIAAIGGDGIGPEVIEATIPVLAAAAALDGAALGVERLDWGGDLMIRTGRAMPADGPELLRSFDAVLFGAVGRPDVPDHELVWGLIIELRQRLGLAVNLRPSRFWAGVPGPLRRPEGIDMLIVRENTEGEYAGLGGRTYRRTTRELAVEVAVHSRQTIEEITRFAFECALSRQRRVSLVTKSNAMRFGYTLWDEVVSEVAAGYPGVEFEAVLVDAMAARMVERPTSLDVVLCGNLFGDVLSDLACSLTGGLGLAPSANISYDRSVPGVYEPVHGSAPTIAGQGIANPCACLLSGALLLDDLGASAGAEAIRTAVASALRDPRSRTPDVAGTATTSEVSAFVVSEVSAAAAMSER